MSHSESYDSMAGVAIVGMAGRFATARNLKEFWQNLCDGKECISFFTDEEVLEAGGAPELLRNPNYVKASGMMNDIDLFDANFFGFNPREAEVTDPQQRIFLECAWEALEDAQCNPEAFKGRICVYAGIGENQYLRHIPPDMLSLTDDVTQGVGNEKDYVATRVSYKANLKAPSITVQCACSTSLVAACMAYQSLLNYQSDVGLAGGVSVDLYRRGRLYTEGGLLSPDGHCRTFDAKAKGTIWGSGAGVVVLKRLADAIADGNRIYAVIRGAAVNNDGSVKIGYTAPSVDGQAAVITEAIELAEVNPETIRYVEAHGTATPLGDPIEVAALTKAYRNYTDRKNFCRIGSVKTNIGHTDTAAGVAGLIKAALCVHHKQIPPSLHFEKPNPQIDFENSPFVVNTSLVDWEAETTPRRAGVSSFGIGGTNAHVVLEEAPPREESSSSRPWQLLVLSARSDTALETATTNLAEHLKSYGDGKLADVAFSLQVGRKEFEYRRALVCRDTQDAITALEERDPTRLTNGNPESENHPIVFMFPGQGTQYPNMGRELYDLEATFRERVDYCSEILQPELGLDLRETLFPAERRTDEAAKLLAQTYITQPALFVIEYALSKLLMEWGLNPEAMIGHSIGEYVAACLAGVFSVEDALRLVAARGRLVQEIEPGAMLAVMMSEQQARSLIGTNLSLAAINAPSLCVISGGHEEIDVLEQQLKAKGELTRRLQTSHAFHSHLMEPAVEQFRDVLRQARLSPPTLPYISNLTGTWITDAEAIDPDYWSAHLRQSVRFSDGVDELLKDTARVLLEVGPGHTLITLVKQRRDEATNRVVAASMRHPQEQYSDQQFLLTALGQLWAGGVRSDWDGFYSGVRADWDGFEKGERRLRVPLPTYPFERTRYWIAGNKIQSESFAASVPEGKSSDIADWFYVPSWKRLIRPSPVAPRDEDQKQRWLIFLDEGGVGSGMAEKLRARGYDVTGVIAGEQYARIDEQTLAINPRSQDDYQALFKELHTAGQIPARIAYLWTIPQSESFEETQTLSFYGPLFLAKAIGSHSTKDSIQIEIVSSGMQDVTGAEELQFEKAILLGPCRVIPVEYSNVSCWSVDLDTVVSAKQKERVIDGLIAEFDAKSPDTVVAYRGQHRWVQCFEAVRLDHELKQLGRVRDGGVYLITGGMGGIGLALAESLAHVPQAKLALVGRSSFPERQNWEQWISTRGEKDDVSRKIRKLQAMEEAGAETLTLSADVADRDQMNNVIGRVRDRFGAINGVIHSAGVPAGGLIQLKTPEMVEPVFSPKVKGTMVLDSLLDVGELDFLVLCSSVASVLGVPGQVDYSAANAFLDGYAHHRARKNGTFTVSVNWDAWAEVGMAVNAKKIWPTGPGRGPNGRGHYQQSDHPLFDEQSLGDDESTYLSEFSAAKQWVLGDHIIMGNPTVVGTSWLEMARAAFERQSRKNSMEISDVVFIQPLAVTDGENKEVRTVLKRVGDNFDFTISSKSSNNGEWRDHAIGKVTAADAKAPESLDIQSLKEKCNLRVVAETEHDDHLTPGEPSSPHLEISFGDRWTGVKRQIHVGEGEALALMELPEKYADDLEKLHLHPSLMDMAVSYLVTYLSGSQDVLPFSYKRVKVYAPLSRRLYSYARHKKDDASDEVLKFDVTILNEEGMKLVDVEECTFRKLGKQVLQALAGGSYGDGPSVIIPAQTPDSAADSDLKDAILPAEGVEVFRRILSMNLPPQVIVSTRDLQYQIDRADSSQTGDVADTQKKPETAKPTHPRPNIKTPFVSPSNELEQTIADIWQIVLGIDKVGVHDNFIALGGHSLLAIQVISRMREAFQIDLPMDVIFKAPTVAELADTVVRTLTEQTDQETLAQLIAEVEELSKA
ncbi:MAG: SDR family NAD(P)-dependent oxidoreductase [Pyrinomonadaceae bacterium]